MEISCPRSCLDERSFTPSLLGLGVLGLFSDGRGVLGLPGRFSELLGVSVMVDGVIPLSWV